MGVFFSFFIVGFLFDFCQRAFLVLYILFPPHRVCVSCIIPTAVILCHHVVSGTYIIIYYCTMTDDVYDRIMTVCKA